MRLLIETKDGLRVDISDPAVLSKAQQYMLDITPDLGLVGYSPLMKWIKARRLSRAARRQSSAAASGC